MTKKNKQDLKGPVEGNNKEQVSQPPVIPVRLELPDGGKPLEVLKQEKDWADAASAYKKKVEAEKLHYLVSNLILVTTWVVVIKLLPVEVFNAATNKWIFAIVGCALAQIPLRLAVRRNNSPHQLVWGCLMVILFGLLQGIPIDVFSHVNGLLDGFVHLAYNVLGCLLCYGAAQPAILYAGREDRPVKKL